MPYTHEQPPLDELDPLQKIAVNRPVNDNEALIITGCPGSGKTTVANYRVKNSNTQNKSVQYLMWTKLLKSYINSKTNKFAERSNSEIMIWIQTKLAGNELSDKVKEILDRGDAVRFAPLSNEKSRNDIDQIKILLRELDQKC